MSLSIYIRLDRKCQKLNSVAVGTEVHVLIYESSVESDTVIYTDRSVVPHQRSAWTFTGQVGQREGAANGEEDSGAFTMTTRLWR